MSMAAESGRTETFDLRRVLTGVGAGQSRLQLAPADVIFTQGDPADAVYYLESGAVKISRVLRLASDSRDDGPDTISGRVSQAVLANMIGTTRPRISFFMNEFRRPGMIEYGRNGQMAVHKSRLAGLLDG